ncbi:MAG: NAD(P)/FAD-dependent oxidoreductase [Nevskia sp.]|nr:NAD(P)/FAD-dependent oxidoreductase [Nevskia sp.]
MGIQHDPLTGAGRTTRRDPRIAIVGAGMSGLLMGIQLKKAGIDSFTIFEKGPAVGGTWRDNTYPGLACDVPARLYTYSFDTNPNWNHRYARGYEIQKYFESVPAKFDLAPHIRFNTELADARHANGEWLVTTKDGQTLAVDFLVTATGILHHPSYPEIKGLESFAGACFHSARWDHGVPLQGKRVGVIGTGSTAVQITTALVDKVAKFELFQRTPQWVCPQMDTAYSETNKRLFARIPLLRRLVYAVYKKYFELTFGRAVVGDKRLMAAISWLCRRHLATVKDPELRRKLTPSYYPACKRLIFSDTFYKAIQHPAAELVTEGIDHVEPRGVVDKSGRLHELDVLVLATGFKAHEYMRPMHVANESGLTLDQAWAKGAFAHRTVGLPGFPNFFMLMGPHSPIGNFSLISIAEMQVRYIMTFIELFRQGKCSKVEPAAEAARLYNDAIRNALKGTVWMTGCRSWYFDQNGLPALWPWTFGRYRHEMKAPRLDEFVLS